MTIVLHICLWIWILRCVISIWSMKEFVPSPMLAVATRAGSTVVPSTAHQVVSHDHHEHHHAPTAQSGPETGTTICCSRRDSTADPPTHRTTVRGRLGFTRIGRRQPNLLHTLTALQNSVASYLITGTRSRRVLLATFTVQHEPFRDKI